jgi:hypothetical protein
MRLEQFPVEKKSRCKSPRVRPKVFLCPCNSESLVLLSGSDMSERKQRDQWLQDVRDRQNNIVFPQTLANETRLWRNLGTRSPTALTWVGLAILAVFVFGCIGYFLVVLIHASVLWAVAVVMLLIFGPMIGV